MEEVSQLKSAPRIWEDKELAKRFVRDMNLPIQVCTEEMFLYRLYKLDAFTEWDELKKMIKYQFGDNTQFLAHYYTVRDDIINMVLKSKEYQDFNTMPMDCFKIDSKDNISSKTVYNQENVGKSFMSVDLKHANFQILRKINKSIVLGANNYEDFIGNFTTLDYIKKSKYFRQVIFGQFNPSRQITIEKFFTNSIYYCLKEIIDSKKFTAISMNNDEIIYESNLTSYDDDKEFYAKAIETAISNKFGLDVNVNFFYLKGYRLYSQDTGAYKFTFYVKENQITPLTKKLVCVPLPYYMIAYKLYNGMEVNEKDQHFCYEETDCTFNESFIIEEL